MSENCGYFGGANGECGFVGYYDTICRGIGRLYIIKGGCGCGKSHLMRAVAAQAEKRGEAVERVYCASDPQSLDGVILRERGVGLLDGTPPHEKSPRCTGAADVLVDLGEYLNNAVLRERRAEIGALDREKQAAYDRVYTLLASAGKQRALLARLSAEALLADKMSKAASRLAARYARPEKAPRLRLRARTAFCGDGYVTAPDYGFSEVCAVRDPFGIAYLFCGALFAACAERGLSLTVSPDPLCPFRAEALRLDAAGALFCGGDGGGRVVNMERFVDRQALRRTRQKRRFLQKAAGSLVEAARKEFAEARACHGKLEAVYATAMDFARADERTAALTAEIFA